MIRAYRFALAAALIPGLAGSAFAATLDRGVVGLLGGDQAPPIRASAWVRGGPLDHYEPGRVYIVDLWATWCTPCLTSMPLLRRYEDRFPGRLTIVAMNVLEFAPDRVPGLVQARADSMPRWVALDSIPPGKEVNEGLTAAAFMGVSDWVSIPRTYLFDGSGRLAWVGTPHSLERPLAEVLAGTWDTDAWAVEYSRQLELDIRFRTAFAPIEAAAMSKRWADALGACESVLASDPTLASRLPFEGFVWVAQLIVAQKAPKDDDLRVARRALRRALDLGASPAWRVHLLAARVARAAGDVRLARQELAKARRLAPAGSRNQVPSSVEALSGTP